MGRGAVWVTDNTRLEGEEARSRMPLAQAVGRVTESPWPSSRGTAHCSTAPGAGRQQLRSDASVQPLRFVMNFLHTVRGCFVFPWLCPHCDSAALSSLYSTLLSLPADWGGRRPSITDGSLLFTPPHPRPHTGLQSASAHASQSVLAVSAGGFPRTRFSC